MRDVIANIADDRNTIAAVSTPPGVGGIAVIRISGPEAIQIADRIWKGKSLSAAGSHTMRLGTILDSQGLPLDKGVASVFLAPHSYTGQDTVEFSVHGSLYIQRELLNALIKAGATLARPGEFTRRAFTSGNLGLTEAEAVADMISSNSRASHRLAMNQMQGSFSNKISSLRQALLELVTLMELELDFSEEDVTFADRTELLTQAKNIQNHIDRLLSSFRSGSAIMKGIPVAIVGPANVGKSSLLNALIESDRAIVSDIRGTTRDTIEETAEIGDFLFRFIDTAGLRETEDPVERMGIERSHRAISDALIIIAMIDVSSAQEGIDELKKIANELQDNQSLIVVFNKIDLSQPTLESIDFITPHSTCNISTKTGEGLQQLKESLVSLTKTACHLDASGDVMVSNQRHAESLLKASDACARMLQAMDSGLPSDLVAQDAREVIDSLGELTGEITTTEVLGNIFSRFCIGK